VGWEELHDGLLVAGQPCGAPSWFPCNDAPAQKAPFRISLTTSSPYTVIANGELVRRRVRGSETTWVYDQHEPMAPYLASVQIGRYAIADDAGAPVPIRVAAPPALATVARRALGDQRAMLDLFVDRFGPYPFGAYTVVVTEEPLDIPFEALGMSVFGVNHLEAEHERLIAHELSHQWFGNSVTPAAWCDIWLNEGFACYAEWLWSEHAGKRTAADHVRAAHQRLAKLPQDLLIGDPGPDDMFDDRLYKRGAITLHGLRSLVGDERFFALLREWCHVHQHSTVSTHDFVALAEARTGLDLAAHFTAWLHEPTLPALS
jgi:aminopeptidase